MTGKPRSAVHRALQFSHASALLGAASLFLLPLSAARAADTVIYKWVDKNGVVSYSQDKPADTDARDVSAIALPTLPPDQQRAANRTLRQLEKSTDAEYAARKSRQQAADARVNAALKRLQDAENRLSEGSTPTGDDRVGMVNGRSRLRDSYFQRVTQLEAEVSQARQNLDAAYAARDQLSY